MTRRRPVTPLAGVAALTLLAACGGPSPEPQAAGSPPAAHAHAHRASRSAPRTSACGMVPGEIPRTGRLSPHETPCAGIGTALVIIKPKPKPKPTQQVMHNPRILSGFAAWASSRSVRLVFGCESHWNPRAVNPSGKYRGLIQADATFWASWGGLRYAPRPDQASTGAQLLVAYRAWKARGWEPWTCARIVGVR